VCRLNRKAEMSMRNSLCRKAWLLVVAITFLTASDLLAAVPKGDDQRIREFYLSLVRSPESVPKYDDLLAIQGLIGSATPAEMSLALPDIIGALESDNEEVRVYAAAGLFAVSSRDDSSRLLAKYVRQLATLLQDPAPRLQAAGVTILGAMRPKPPAEVVCLLIDFIRDGARIRAAQASAVFQLLRIAPADPDVAGAVVAHLALDLPPHHRINVLNALGQRTIQTPAVIRSVIQHLQYSEEPVRFTATQVLSRMGRDAVRTAAVDLRRVADDPRESRRTKSAALEALRLSRAP
jgi:HEAT repeat protein